MQQKLACVERLVEQFKVKLQAKTKEAEDLQGQLEAQKEAHAQQAYEFETLNEHLQSTVEDSRKCREELAAKSEALAQMERKMMEQEAGDGAAEDTIASLRGNGT